MMNHLYQYMVNFSMPEELPEAFFELMPYQETIVDRYLSEGKLINYALSLEQGQLWAIFNANSEMEVLEMIIDFPLTEFMRVEVSLLNSYRALEHPAPEFSLN